MSTISPKVIYWGKTLSKFISVQLVIQALAFASGIFVVRTLEQQQYAYFTIANTMQGTMNLLADSGISSGLTAIGGKVWQDRYRLGQLINTALQLRIFLAAISIVTVTPILLWMLISNGASVIYAIWITAAVLVGLNAQLTVGVLEVVPRLHSQISRVQNLELIPTISRLLLLLGAYFTIWNAAVAVLTASISLLLKRLVLSHWVKDSVDIKAPAHKEDRKEISKIIKDQAPTTVFYCIQGQLTVWLISIFGNTTSIAEIGALGRLGMIFTIISSVMGNIVLPSFARCQSPTLLGRRYWQILGIYCSFALVLVGFAGFFPGELLWILGKQYAHLKNEVLLIVLSSVTQSFGSILWSINATKAWTQYTWLFIPIIITTQVLLIVFLNISTVRGVILFNLFSILPALFLNFYMTYKGIKAYESS